MEGKNLAEGHGNSAPGIVRGCFRNGRVKSKMVDMIKVKGGLIIEVEVGRPDLLILQIDQGRT